MASKKVWRWVEEADGQGGALRYQVAQIVPLDPAEEAARAAAAAAPLTVSRLALVNAAVAAGLAPALLAHLDGKGRVERERWAAAVHIAENDPDLLAARDALAIAPADWRALFEAAAADG